MAAVSNLRPRALVSFSGTAPPGLLALAREGPDPAAVLGSICRQVRVLNPPTAPSMRLSDEEPACPPGNEALLPLLSQGSRGRAIVI